MNQEIPCWDYRHPVKKIVNAYIAVYRDLYPNEPNIPALQYAINGALAAIREQGYIIYADGTTNPVISIYLGVTEDAGRKIVNIEFCCED